MNETGTDTVNETAAEVNPHAQSVLTLAAAMLKATLVVGLGTIAVAVVVSTIWVGIPGMLGALVGGAVAFGSAMATIWMMRFCAAMDPMFVMAVVLGSYVVKVLILLGVMTALKGVEVLHPMALGLTMLAAVILTAAAEVRAFRRTKIPTIIPNS